LPGYVFRVFVTNRRDAALEIWRDYNGRATVECRIDELKNELAADHFCLRSFFATESAFLAVLFGFNLLGEFQRALNPALKTYKQPATLRFEVFHLRGNPRTKRTSSGPAHVHKLGRLLQSKTVLQ
jgi:hypothetical protein